MNDVVDLTYARLNTEEGRRAKAYNDGTGKTVTCQPSGNLSIAVGVNLEEGLAPEEIDWLSTHRLGKTHVALRQYAWYRSLDTDVVRQSVLLDIAFNEGIGGLLRFPHMLAAIASGDWTVAAAQCHVTDPRLKSRYDALAHLLFVGSTP